MQEEADAEVGPQRAQHRRHEVQLVVVDPHGRVLRGHRRGEVGEALVRLDVALPPLAAELGRAHRVVVERPQRAVREALVEALDLARVEPDRRQPHAAVVERLGRRSGDSGPAHPGSAPGLDDRRQRAHQPAWADFPGAVVGAHDGQAVRDDDDLAGRRLPRAHIATVAPQAPRRARAGCLCAIPCGSVPPMNAQRILASGAAALLVLIVLAIVFHDEGGSKGGSTTTLPTVPPGTLRAHVVAGNITLDGPVLDADEKRSIEDAADERFGDGQRRQQPGGPADRAFRGLARRGDAHAPAQGQRLRPGRHRGHEHRAHREREGADRRCGQRAARRRQGGVRPRCHG